MTRLNYKTAATIQIVLTAVAVTALSRKASAQEAEPAAAPPAAPAEEAPASRYPRSVIDRPLTLPKGLVMLGADFTGNHDFSLITAAPIVGYGITDDLEVQVPYSLTLDADPDGFEAKGPLNLEVGYKLLRGAAGGKLEMIARGRIGYDFLAETSALLLGLHVQYNATPKLAFITGLPGTQQLKITLATPDVNGMSGPTPVDFSIPFGIGVQPTKELYLELDTKLAQFNISDSADVYFGADATPLFLTVLYNAMPHLDVQAIVGLDASADSPDQTLSFLVGARYYAGSL
jgi:hypothetical protein